MLPLLVAPPRSPDFGDDRYDGSETPPSGPSLLASRDGCRQLSGGGQHRGHDDPPIGFRSVWAIVATFSS